jgi:hypothetical protein
MNVIGRLIRKLMARGAKGGQTTTSHTFRLNAAKGGENNHASPVLRLSPVIRVPGHSHDDLGRANQFEADSVSLH